MTETPSNQCDPEADTLPPPSPNTRNAASEFLSTEEADRHRRAVRTVLIGWRVSNPSEAAQLMQIRGESNLAKLLRNERSVTALEAAKSIKVIRAYVLLQQYLNDGQEAHLWIRKDLPELGGRSPLEAMKNGEVDLIMELLKQKMEK